MGTYAIRVLRNGQPVAGAEVIAGEAIYGTTGADGRVSAVLTRATPLAVQVVVSGTHAEGGAFEHGGGPYTLRPDQDLAVEV